MTLAVVGEVALADSYCKQFGLDPSGLPLQGEALAQSCKERDAMFLGLTIPPKNIHFVNSSEVCPEHIDHLLCAKALQEQPLAK